MTCRVRGARKNMDAASVWTMRICIAVIFVIIAIPKLKGVHEMITGLLALATAHIGFLGSGIAAGGLIETVLPMLTAAHKARTVLNAVRSAHKKLHGRDLTPQEIARLKFDPNVVS